MGDVAHRLGAVVTGDGVLLLLAAAWAHASNPRPPRQSRGAGAARRDNRGGRGGAKAAGFCGALPWPPHGGGGGAKQQAKKSGARGLAIPAATIAGGGVNPDGAT